MDYKQRNPNIKYWPNSESNPICAPFPYDEPARVHIFELDAPDFSTQFLGLPFHISENEELFITCLIEAPETCPMRRKYEFGDITWEEFWQHRGWLIEYQYEFRANGGAHVRYIHPSEMVERKRSYLTNFNHESPMALKLQELESRSTFNWHLGDNMEELAERLVEFREIYPEIVLRTASKSKAA